MTTSLHDRLADLAGDAPPGGPVPDLWERGRRHHRQQRMGTVIIAAVAVLALVALGTLSWSRSRVEPIPAAPTGTLRLPDRFFVPSPRTPGVGDQPIGPVVAVFAAPRHGSTYGGLTAVSGGTGEYRFLDLPGWVNGDSITGSSDVALSADGRHLAYWYGSTDVPGEGDADVGDRRLDGVAVYETATGDVERFPIDSDHGVSPTGMGWVGDRVWFGYLRYTDETRRPASGRHQVVWDPEAGDVARSDGPAPNFWSATDAGTALITTGGRTVERWSGDELRRTDRWRAAEPLYGETWQSPDGGRFGGMVDPDGDPSSDNGKPGRVVLLTPGDRGRFAETRVPDLRVNRVVGWRDDRHLVVVDFRDPAHRSTYRSVDVRTGAVDDLTASDNEYQPVPTVARDAWSAPVYHAHEPPSPMDPRLVWGGAAAIVLLAAGALVVWRRRVRA
jgi:hypothetical protein